MKYKERSISSVSYFNAHKDKNFLVKDKDCCSVWVLCDGTPGNYDFTKMKSLMVARLHNSAEKIFNSDEDLDIIIENCSNYEIELALNQIQACQYLN